MDENIFQSDESIETIMEVDSIEDHDTLLYNSNMSETSSQYHYSQFSLDEESLMIIEDDDEGSLSENSGCIKEKSESNIKISEQKKNLSDKFENTTEVLISDKQVPIKKKIVSAVVLNTRKNANLSTRPKNDSLSLEKIAVPKQEISKVNLSPIISRQIKKNPSVTVVSSSSVKSTTTHPKILPRPLSITNINCNKSFSRPKQDFKIVSSNEPKTGIYVLPQNGVNYMIKTGESKSLSLKSNSDTVLEPAVGKQRIIVTSKVPQRANNNVVMANNNQVNTFVARMQKLPGGTYKVLPAQGKVPVDLENVFKRNNHFVKQKMLNDNKTNNFIGKSNIHTNTNEINQFQSNRPISTAKAWHFGNVSKDKRLIPHTITSKDLLENRKNISIEKCEIKLNSNDNHEIKQSEYMVRQQMSESLNQSLSIDKYGKVSKNDNLMISLSPLHQKNTESNTKLKTTDNTTTTDNTNNITVKVLPVNVHAQKDTNIDKEVVNNKAMLLSEEMNLEQNEVSEEEEEPVDESEQFVSCRYAFCQTLVHEPELIDNLFCSLHCKNANSISQEDKSNIDNEIKKPTEKLPYINRKQLLAKIGNRIHKRKQMLTVSCPEKVSQNNDWDELDQFDNNGCEKSLTHNKKSHQIVKGVEDHDNVYNNVDDDIETVEVLDLKSHINDVNLLIYVEEMQFKSAPKMLFDRPFPNEENFFRVGLKLEGIDPEHESLFCVMSVVEVCGYRIKLHFDGYPSDYDFWVNADCPDLFYPRWCEENSRKLQPPKDYVNTFDWADYLLKSNGFEAPKQNFAITKNSPNVDHQFTIGAKLEALDKLTRTLPKQLICVATVADILYNRVRIHFDGWTDDFDYWTDITSTNIHPVGWCDNNGRSLSPPSGFNDHKGRKPFSWAEYLKETKSKPVPENAFVRRPLRDFGIKMTIEVVDIVVPSLIRIAEIIDVRGDELKILYDGFHSNYAYWVEDDSPDIHPVGWSLKTNHPIEIPPAIDNLLSCQVMGCNGKGNTNDKHKNDHTFIRDCPYELDSWKLAVAGLGKLPDRIKGDKDPTLTASENNTAIIKLKEDEKKNEKSKLKTNVHNNVPKQKKKKTNNKSNEKFGIKNVRPECNKGYNKLLVKHNISKSIVLSADNDVRSSTAFSLMPEGLTLNNLSLGKRDDNKLWTKHNAQLGTPLFDTTNVLNWTPEQVAYYVNELMLTKYPDRTKETVNIPVRFIDHEIDGEAFLMLNQDELLEVLRIPLGLTLKIHCAILLLRNRVPIFDFIESTHCTKD